MEIALHLNVRAPAEARDINVGMLEEKLMQVANVMIDLHRTGREVKVSQLAEMFLGDVVLTPADMASARLEARGFRQIIEGSQWFSAQELGELANLGQGNPVATVNRWKKERKVFALHRDGRDRFPKYAFGSDFRPLPAMARVLKILGWIDEERLAAWFESTSSFLGGKRPRELISSEPQRVLAAAQDAVEAEQFAG